jgi:hypothetical protein
MANTSIKAKAKEYENVNLCEIVTAPKRRGIPGQIPNVLTAAQSVENYDFMRCSTLLVFIVLQYAVALSAGQYGVPDGCDTAWSFAVLSDVHIGDANAQKVRLAGAWQH